MQPAVGREELAAVKGVLKSGYLSDGEQSRRLAERVAERVGCRFGVATSSGTAALHVALMALGVGRGDEVIVPDYTHPATALAVWAAGAEPVLVDIDPRTFNLDAAKAEQAVSGRTRAVIGVSLFGHPLDLAQLLALAAAHGLHVIEDAACSLGAELGGVPSGRQAHLSCFSLHPRKVVTSGEGGVLVTNSPEWAERARAAKTFGAVATGQPGRLSFEAAGLNYKLSDVLAAIGLAQMDKLDAILAKRREQAALYDDLLRGSEDIAPPYVQPGARHTYQSYCCLLRPGLDRDDLLGRLRAEGIECQIGTYSLHRQPFFRQHFFARAGHSGTLTVSAGVFERALTLPLHQGLSERDQRRVCRRLLALAAAASPAKAGKRKGR